MSKHEFLKELKEALEGLVPRNVMEDNIRYYDNYFHTGKEQGKSEEEIANELGSPRLIARTIIDASGNSDETIHYDGEVEQEAGYESETKVYTVNSTMAKIGCALSVIVILVVLFLLFKVFMAVLGPLLIICVVIYIIKQIMN